MKINNNYNRFLQSVQNTQKQLVTKKEENKVQGTNRKAVEISFSEEAKKLSEISHNAAHAQRVDDIKNAIQDGSYEVDPKEITNSILQTIKNQRGSAK